MYLFFMPLIWVQLQYLFMYRLTPTLHTHTTLTPRVYKQTYNLYSDHQIASFARSPGPTMDPQVTGRVAFPLWLHVRGNKIYLGMNPVRDVSVIAGNRTRAGCKPTGYASQGKDSMLMILARLFGLLPQPAMLQVWHTKTAPHFWRVLACK